MWRRSQSAAAMGHQRLGVLPRSKHWKEVVELIGAGADVQDVAAATARAAEASMMDASGDPAVQHAFWLLAKLPLAARNENFQAALAELGVRVPGEDPTLIDVVSGVMQTIDRHTHEQGLRSDYGEIAQLSAAE